MAVPANAQIAVFEDGDPFLASIDEIKEAIGVPTIERLIAEKAADAATGVGAIVGITNARLDDVRYDIETIIPRFDPIESDISAIKDADVARDEALAGLLDATIDQTAIANQIERDAGRVSATLLLALAEANRTRQVLRDAGISVDPATGIVRIYAIDQIANRTSAAEIALDVQRAQITTKASVNFVQEQIALAVLDPSQVAQLEPIIARLASAEQDIDGLNARVATKAEVVDLTAVGGRVTTAEQLLDALAGTVSTKVAQTDFDRLAVRTGSVEQTLSSLGDVSGITTTIRQARSVADDSAEATLAGLVATDASSQRSIVAAAEIRQELYAKIEDGRSAEATARATLAVMIGDLDSRAVTETKARVADGSALSQRIDALGVTTDGQAAAIGTLQRATIDNGVGIAGAQTTIRQQADDAATSGEALLASLVAGDQGAQRVSRQLVQIQTELTTTLIASDRASAIARQSLLVRMGDAEAATEAVSKVVADTTQSLVDRIAAGEAVFNDASTGLAATRARLVVEETDRATAVKAQSDRIDALSATVLDPATGLAATAASVGAASQASADAASALGRRIDDVNAALNDPATGLAASSARVTRDAEASTGRDTALGLRIDTVSSMVTDPDTGLAATSASVGAASKASTDRDAALGERIDTITAQVNDPASGLPNAYSIVAEDRQARIDGDSALSQSVAEVRIKTGDVDARITDLRSAVVGPDGTKLRALTVLDVNGRVTGTVNTNDGTVSDFGVTADRFYVVHPDTGAPLFYVDVDGAVVQKLKIGAVDVENLALGSGAVTDFYIIPNDVAIPQGQTVTVGSKPFHKYDAASVLEVLFFANMHSPDDLIFAGNILIDGGTQQSTEARLIFDNTNSQGRMPITPFAIIPPGLAAGDHTIAITITNNETDASGPLLVKAGSAIKYTEYRKALLGPVVGAGSSPSAAGDGTTSSSTGSSVVDTGGASSGRYQPDQHINQN